mmetsp:Transcript_12485/g.37661  ORF Transcript_12485/g.37661 Transcript_12485/m.37661 type:complete len:461 (+) Transcript_12485:574-1956(+)
MRDRKISRKITGDGVLFVVTTAPFFVGNAPKEAAHYANGRAVVMIGQAPVNVVGDVKSNAVLVPSGRDDGTARAAADAPFASGIVAMEDASSSSEAKVDSDARRQVMCLVNAGAVVYKAKVQIKNDSKEEDDDALKSRLKFVGSAVEAAAKIGRRARVLIAVQRRKAQLQASLAIVRVAKRSLELKKRRAVRLRVTQLQALARGASFRSSHPAARVLAKLRRANDLLQKTKAQPCSSSKIIVESSLASATLVHPGDVIRLAYKDPEGAVNFACSSGDFWTTIPTTTNGDLAEAYVPTEDLAQGDALLAVVGQRDGSSLRYTWKASHVLGQRPGAAYFNGGRAQGSAAKFFVDKRAYEVADSQQREDAADDGKVAGLLLAASRGAAISEDLARLLATKVRVEIKPNDACPHIMAAEPATILDVRADGLVDVECQCLDPATQQALTCVNTLAPDHLRLRVIN